METEPSCPWWSADHHDPDIFLQGSRSSWEIVALKNDGERAAEEVDSDGKEVPWWIFLKIYGRLFAVGLFFLFVKKANL